MGLIGDTYAAGQRDALVRFKLAEDVPKPVPCTTCRKPRHYGPCKQERGTKPAGEPFAKR